MMSSWRRWDLNKELAKIKDWDYFLGRKLRGAKVMRPVDSSDVAKRRAAFTPTKEDIEDFEREVEARNSETLSKNEQGD